jgi:hypothetical protein
VDAILLIYGWGKETDVNLLNSTNSNSL